MSTVVPPPGSLGEAINVFFDRTSDMFPVWVGKKRAHQIALVIASLVLLVSFPYVNDLKKDSNTPHENAQWIAASIIVIVGTVVLHGKIVEIVYNYMNIASNTQHLSNMHWIGEYAKAFRK